MPSAIVLDVACLDQPVCRCWDAWKRDCGTRHLYRHIHFRGRLFERALVTGRIAMHEAVNANNWLAGLKSLEAKNLPESTPRSDR